MEKEDEADLSSSGEGAEKGGEEKDPLSVGATASEANSSSKAPLT